MNETKQTCYYCSEEKPAAAIFKYEDESKETRLICSDCQNAGKHWGT